MYKEVSDAIEYFTNQGIPKDILVDAADKALDEAIDEEKYFYEELQRTKFNEETSRDAIIEDVIEKIEDRAWDYQDNNTDYHMKWYDLTDKIGEILSECSNKVMDLTHKLERMEVITNNDRADYGNLKHELDIYQAKKDVLEQVLDES